MDENEKLEQHEKARREFLSCFGSVIASGVAAVAANSISSQATAATQEATAASRHRQSRDMIGQSINGHSASMPKNASAVCAA